MPSYDERELRIVVTGNSGQVARSLIERGPTAGVSIMALGRPVLDLAHPETIGPALAAVRPDAIVNAAAYTAVDKAESEPGLALAINGAGAGAVAAAAARLDVPLVHISTDYVFDGTNPEPYRESDAVAPLGAYGRSKLAGEQAVAAATADHAILRAAWVYSPFGGNFIKTMLRLAADRPEIAVVADQHGCPTSALDLADGILRIARGLIERRDDATLRGCFHLTGSGATTWAGLAEHIFATSAAVGGAQARVKSIATADFPTPARRPANSRLDCGKVSRTHGVVLPDWRQSVHLCVERLIQE